MSVSVYDINAVLVRKVKALTAAGSGASLQASFAKAPLMRILIEFLDSQREEKFRVQDAVLHLYGAKTGQADYSTYENRFFKLRKKLYDHFQYSPSDVHPVFAPQEIQLHEIKNLSLGGKYQEAYVLLVTLEEKLWADNIFELLPEVIDLLIHNNQVQRKFADNEVLYARLDLAIELSAELAMAKKLARYIYDVNLTQGISFVKASLRRLQRISVNRKEYPRFKLIYNLVSATCKLAGGGLDFQPDFKITNRYIHVIQQLHAKYPGMPDYRYIAGYSDTQSYMFANFEVMNNFNAFQFREAANLMRPLYDLVIAENSPMKRMKGDVFYSSACLVLNLGDRHRDALAVAKDYLQHLTEIKQLEKLLYAYIEIITAHIWLHPVKSGYSNAIMFKKLDEFIRTVKTQPYSHYYLAMANWLKIKLLLITGGYEEAQQMHSNTDFSSYFMDTRLSAEVAASLGLLQADMPEENRRKAITDQVNKLKLCRLSCKLPPDYSNFKFLENFMTHVAKNISVEYA
jgi:hypothetical protein